jgi:uncharacterized protein (DUF58 family)
MRMLAGMTTRGIAFVTAGIVAALAGYLLGERGLLCVGVALVALPLLAVVSARRGQYRISAVRMISPPRTPVGHTANVTLRLENVARAPTGLLLAEDTVPYALGTRPRYVLDKIERRGVRDVTYPLRSDLRGKFEIGPLQLRVADSFGLVELTRAVSGRTTFVVTPRVVPLSRTVISQSWAGDGDGRTRMSSTAGEDDVIPREYRDGDELRRVHWRSTARYGELMVRREEQRWRNRASILLDTRAASHSGTTGTASSSFEAAVSAAASAGMHIVQEGLTGQLITDGAAIPGGPLFGDALLDTLAVARPSSRRNLDRAFAELRTSSGLIIAIMGRLPAAEARLLAACRSEGSQGLALLLDAASWIEGSGSGSAVAASAQVSMAALDGAATSSAANSGAATSSAANGSAATSSAAAITSRATISAGDIAPAVASDSSDAASTDGQTSPASKPAAPRAAETAAAEAILRGAGWRVTVLDADTPLSVAWRQLSLPSSAFVARPSAASSAPTAFGGTGSKPPA